jgi:hypothetical protein
MNSFASDDTGETSPSGSSAIELFWILIVRPGWRFLLVILLGPSMNKNWLGLDRGLNGGVNDGF